MTVWPTIKTVSIQSQRKAFQSWSAVMNDSRDIALFVPGRICLFGEHSDWAGGYRRINSELEKGYTIITGTNQGLYARVRRNDKELVFHSALGPEGRETFRCPMQPKALLEVAEKGGFWSYIAGTAYQMLVHHHVKGIEIDNDRTDLPVKKGLSSSAAVCVLTARAFNRLYDLKLTVRGEMDLAYRGEITTPSRCGRMDQGCAFGSRPILIEYDGDMLGVDEIQVGADLSLLIVDLKSKKNTIKILKDLNSAYPFADNDTQRAVQEYLGLTNKALVSSAVRLLRSGDVKGLGALMTEAQNQFDAKVMPACREELAAPVLHKVLSYKGIQHLIWGGKGVGSQGDGAAQLLCRDESSRSAAKRIIEDKLGMEALELTIAKTKKIRKAVITAAGFGTRLFPMTKIIRKEFMPVLGRDGVMKPLLIANIEEAFAAGMEEIILIISAEELPLFKKLINEPVEPAVFEKLTTANKEYARLMEEMGARVTYAFQNEQKGLGHAVLQARHAVGDEAFLLILGDHYFRSWDERICARQLLDAHEKLDAMVIGLSACHVSQIHRFGAAYGAWQNEAEGIVEILEMYEKPSREYAETRMKVEGLKSDHYLTVFGQYVLPGAIFQELETMLAEECYENGELQLTTALERLRMKMGMYGLLINGERIDIGTPDGFVSAIQ
jgi:UTP-glucose-1-phosphate uridylyltransferase/mevalonate kinase